VPVVMVATDQLQRIPGAGPGTVRHRGGEVLRAEPQRAASLLRELADRGDRPNAGEAPDKPAPARANPAQIPLGQAASVQRTSVQKASVQPASAGTTPVAATPAGVAAGQAAAEQAVAARAVDPPKALQLPSLGPASKP
jgi:hypothetical protein